MSNIVITVENNTYYKSSISAIKKIKGRRNAHNIFDYLKVNFIKN